jgi:hypothetical protein
LRRGKKVIDSPTDPIQKFADELAMTGEEGYVTNVTTDEGYITNTTTSNSFYMNVGEITQQDSN